MRYTVYILHSPKHHKIYIGFTSNLEQRILSHNHLAKKGFTVRFRPWKLLYTESFDSKEEALKREKQLKSSRGRAWIKKELLQE